MDSLIYLGARLASDTRKAQHYQQNRQKRDQCLHGAKIGKQQPRAERDGDKTPSVTCSDHMLLTNPSDKFRQYVLFAARIYQSLLYIM